MRADFVHKTLSSKQAFEIALAIARGDAKRMHEVAQKVGGIDFEALVIAVALTDEKGKLRLSTRGSAAVLRRVLARAPQELFDDMAEAMSLSKPSRVFSRWAFLGMGQEPKAVTKLLAGCRKAGQEANNLLAHYATLILGSKDEKVDPGRESVAASKGLGESASLIADYFRSLNEVELVSIQEHAKLKGKDLLMIDEALAMIERDKIASEWAVSQQVRCLSKKSL